MVQPDRPRTIMQYGARTLHAGYLSYRHTLRICNTYCLSDTIIATRTRRNVTFIRTLAVSFLNVTEDGTHGYHWAISPVKRGIFLTLLVYHQKFWQNYTLAFWTGTNAPNYTGSLTTKTQH